MARKRLALQNVALMLALFRVGGMQGQHLVEDRCAPQSVQNWTWMSKPLSEDSNTPSPSNIGIALQNLTFKCERGAFGPIPELNLNWSIQEGITQCLGSEEVCSLINQQNLLERHRREDAHPYKEMTAQLAVNGVSIKPPGQEWEQVLVFIFCFLGIGAALEVFALLFLSFSIGALFQKRPTENRQRVFSDGSDPQHMAEGEVPLLEETLQEGRVPSSPVETSLAQSQIPLHAKILVPFAVLLTIVLFIQANTRVGSTVQLLVEYKMNPWDIPIWHPKPIDKDFGPYNIFEFSLVNTITDMYSGGVYILALLVLVWSGMWPYVKLLLILFCWFATPAYLGVKKRERMLIVFNAMGKWCLIDIFLMTMMSVAFRFHVVSDSVPFTRWILPRQWVGLDVMVTSESGLFLFIIAAILSLVMNHVVLGYHRTAGAQRVSSLIEQHHGGTERKRPRFCFPCPRRSWFNVGSDEVPRNMLLANKRATVAHVFRTRENQPLVIGISASAAVSMLVFAAMSLTLIGAFMESFQFEFTGLARDAIKIAQPESLIRRHSLVSIALAMDPGDDTLLPSDHAGILFLQIVYLSFALLMPIVLCVFLLALWLIPMSLRDQKIVFHTSEVISSWAALDCFIVSIIAACVEINQFAQFLIGDKCDFLHKYTTRPCFGIETTLLSGCWVVVLAALLLFIATQLVLQICEQVMVDRELEALHNNTGADTDTNTAYDPYNLDTSSLPRARCVPPRQPPRGLLAKLIMLQ